MRSTSTSQTSARLRVWLDQRRPLRAVLARGRRCVEGRKRASQGLPADDPVSDGLDFSSPFELDPDQVLAQLNVVCEYARAGAGIDFDIDLNRLAGEQQIDRDRHVYKYRLYFKDLIGDRDHITLSLRVDMTEYDRLQMEPVERQLIHPYSDADACITTLRCVAIEEALADKMKCLLQRRYCYDLFDLVCVARRVARTVVEAASGGPAG